METTTMEKNFTGMQACWMDPRYNDEASKFIAENLSTIRVQARKMGVDPEKVDDLVSDVWVSIRSAELNGEGYDISYSNEDDIITVEEFVYGRIKGYSRNVKYHSGVMEKRLNRSDITKSIEVIPASFDETTELDNLNGFQKAYAMAASYDNLDSVEAELSLRNNIEYCLSFDEEVGFSILNLFKNIHMFSDGGFNNSLFDNFKAALKYHDEFCIAFKEVMEVALNNKGAFDAVVQSI